MRTRSGLGCLRTYRAGGEIPDIDQPRSFAKRIADHPSSLAGEKNNSALVPPQVTNVRGHPCPPTNFVQRLVRHVVVTLAYPRTLALHQGLCALWSLSRLWREFRARTRSRCGNRIWPCTHRDDADANLRFHDGLGWGRDSCSHGVSFSRYSGYVGLGNAERITGFGRFTACVFGSLVFAHAWFFPLVMRHIVRNMC